VAATPSLYTSVNEVRSTQIRHYPKTMGQCSSAARGTLASPAILNMRVHQRGHSRPLTAGLCGLVPSLSTTVWASMKQDSHKQALPQARNYAKSIKGAGRYFLGHGDLLELFQLYPLLLAYLKFVFNVSLFEDGSIDQDNVGRLY